MVVVIEKVVGFFSASGGIVDVMAVVETVAVAVAVAVAKAGRRFL